VLILYQPESNSRLKLKPEKILSSIFDPVIISLKKYSLSKCDPLVPYPPSSSNGTTSQLEQL
jgi:hypothetical protein